MFLHHAGIRVRDLERAHRFYTDILGLREVVRGTMEHGGVYVQLEDRISHQRLELNWYPPGSKYDTEWKHGEELDHLRVRTTDVEGAVRRLVGAGAKEVERVRHGDEDLVFVEDPDGITIELIPTPPV